VLPKNVLLMLPLIYENVISECSTQYNLNVPYIPFFSCLQVKALEAELEECALRKQLVQLQRQLEILDEEKKETEGRLQEEEKKKHYFGKER